MQAFFTLMRRELAGFLLSLSGYVIIACATFLLGLGFVVVLVNVGSDPHMLPATVLFFWTPFFWIILLPAIPVITMRLFAAEKASGTFETLMTTPVTDLQVVLAKFSAALIFYMFMWLPLLGCLLIIHRYTVGSGGLDTGAVASTYLGILLLGCLFLSMGCLASALTRSQVTAAMIALALCVAMFMVSFFSDRVPEGDWKSHVFAFFALSDQMLDFARGVVDTRPVVFCVSVTFVFLFLTLRVLESRRWK